MILVYNNNLSFSIVIYNFEKQSFFSYPVVFPSEYQSSLSIDNSQFVNVSYHSTDFFAISILHKIIPFQFDNDHHQYISYPCFETPNEDSYITFLLCSCPILAAYFNSSLNFLQMRSSGFKPLKVNNSSQYKYNQHSITGLCCNKNYNNNNNELLIATNHLLRKINIDPLSLSPSIKFYDKNSQQAFLTAVSLCYPYQALNVDSNNLNSEVFSQIQINFPKLVDIDEDPLAYRYLMWITMSKLSKTSNELLYPTLKNYSGYFSLLALFSNKQAEIINSLDLSSFKELDELFIPLWARNNDILKIAIEQVIKKLMVYDSVFDRAILLSLAINNKRLASVIAKKCKKDLLSSYLRIIDTDHINSETYRKKLISNAYAAQKQNRLELSAAFFLAANDSGSSLFLLHRLIEQNPSIDHQMLYILVCRLINNSQWHEFLSFLILSFQFPNLISSSRSQDKFQKFGHLYSGPNKSFDDINIIQNSISSNSFISKSRILSDLNNFTKLDNQNCEIFDVKEFYTKYWTESIEVAIEYLKTTPFPKSNEISLGMHQYELLYQINHKNISLLFEMTEIPSLTSYAYFEHPFYPITITNKFSNNNDLIDLNQLNNSYDEFHSIDRSNKYSFNFGSTQWDLDFSEEEEDNDENSNNNEENNNEENNNEENNNEENNNEENNNNNINNDENQQSHDHSNLNTNNDSSLAKSDSSIFDSNLQQIFLQTDFSLINNTNSNNQTNINEIIRALSILYNLNYSIEIINFLINELKSNQLLLIKYVILFSIAFIYSDIDLIKKITSLTFKLESLTTIINQYIFPTHIITSKPKNAYKIFKDTILITPNDSFLTNALIFIIFEKSFHQFFHGNISLSSSFDGDLCFKENLNSTISNKDKNQLKEQKTVHFSINNSKNSTQNNEKAIDKENIEKSDDHNDIEKLEQLQNYMDQILWTVLYSTKIHFQFSKPELTVIFEGYFSNNITKLLLDFEKRERNKEAEIALSSPDRTIFCIHNTFHYNRAHIIKTQSIFPISSITINNFDNTQIAASNSSGIFIPLVSKRDSLRNSFSNPSFINEYSLGNDLIDKSNDESNSLFSEISSSYSLSPLKILVNGSLFNKFVSFKKVEWGKQSPSKQDINSIDSHPKSPLFITGDSSGHIIIHPYYIEYLNLSKQLSVKKIQFTNKPISQLQYSPNGSNILFTDKSSVFITDLSALKYKIPISNNNPISLSWLNDTDQYIIYSSSIFSIYDTRCLKDQNSPVLKYSLQKNEIESIINRPIFSPTNKEYFGINDIPMAVHGPFVVIGQNQGHVQVIDIRIPSLISSINLHSDKVTALKFDPSGTFFATGSLDNSVHIIQSSTFSQLHKFDNLLPPNIDDRKGILSIDTSHKVIAISGYSNSVAILDNFEIS